MIATMTSGKRILMPKTAMAIPQVMNRCRHTGAIFFSTTALTTALSNDSETSRIASTATINIVERAPLQLCVAPQPRKAPTPNPPAVTNNEFRKYPILASAYGCRIAQSATTVQGLRQYDRRKRRYVSSCGQARDRARQLLISSLVNGSL